MLAYYLTTLTTANMRSTLGVTTPWNSELTHIYKGYYNLSAIERCPLYYSVNIINSIILSNNLYHTYHDSWKVSLFSFAINASTSQRTRLQTHTLATDLGSTCLHHQLLCNGLGPRIVVHMLFVYVTQGQQRNGWSSIHKYTPAFTPVSLKHLNLSRSTSRPL